MRVVAAGEIVWRPSAERMRASAMWKFGEQVARGGGPAPDAVGDLWRWSVDDPDRFWKAVAKFYGVDLGAGPALAESAMPGARWFPEATVNYAAEAIGRLGTGTVLIHMTESGELTSWTRDDLVSRVHAVATGLRRLGVGTGDRVAAYVPNVPEAVVAFLATASLGAIWSACPPEFGPRSVVERFGQIEPKVLFAAEEYRYRGKVFDRRDVVSRLRSELPSLQHVVGVPYGGRVPAPHSGEPTSVTWSELAAATDAEAPVGLSFDHPLWIVYSSGTTGAPKPIVHGHGGVVLEHLKWLGLHTDLGAADRFFWFTTTGWIMWNAVVGALLTGSGIVLYDGDPAYPDIGSLWRLAEQSGVTCFGGSPPFFDACRRAGFSPGREHDLSHLRSVGSTGAPLSPDGFAWILDAVAPDVHIGSASGGTDIASAFVGPHPLLPVRAGEIQSRFLGARVEAFDPSGQSLVDEVGELVVTAPMPSMPVGFWNDPDGARYRDSYFATFPGVWRHGDWIRITEEGGCVITGRSDATLKRSGVRMGTAEFYTVVEALDEIADALVVDVPVGDTTSRLVLLVVPADGVDFDAALERRVADRIRVELSPRHVPDLILPIPEIPRTLNGKKIEVPVKQIFMGADADTVLSRGSIANPSAVDAVVAIAARFHGGASE